MNSPKTGIYTASLTPFTSSYDPEISVLISHVQWLLENGSDGVALLGSTGEANSMTLEHRQTIIEQSTRKLPADRLMIGTGSCALEDAVRLTKVSIDSGVYAVLVLPPFYYKPQSEESIIRFYSELIAAVNDSRLRIIFYNFPKFTGYNFDHNVIGKMKQSFGEIAAGIKDSSGNWGNMSGVVQNVSDFMVYSGTETFLLETLLNGGAGCITATANLVATECQQVFQAWKNEQIEDAKQKQNKLTLLRKAFESYPFVSVLKSIFADQKDSNEWNHMMPPFDGLMKDQLHELKEKIKYLGLDLSKRLS
ncbi:dihydrodipicolinate synthase family protein [Deltaproteobacteria bacterium]|nr:dihydrodipicolinate synthase family protein [Deltaproteobacteria bacterium]